MRISADGAVVGDVVSLLTSCKKSFLVSGDGDKVPISFLEGKAVGFYFYIYGLDEISFLDLKKMSENLKDQGEKFELVFVCLHLVDKHKHVEEKFNRYFKGTKLLALPFSQRKSNRKLYDRLNKYSAPFGTLELVIIRPGENIAHTYAMTIFKKYGIGAYPFSKSKVTEIEVARLKSLTLNEVLFNEEHKFVLGQNGEKIGASHLVGKKILLFLTTQAFADLDVCRDEKVIARYNEMKRKDEAFEMIRVLYNYNQLEEVPSYNMKVPWLEFPYDEGEMNALGETLLPEAMPIHNFLPTLLPEAMPIHNFLPMFVTFGRDGRFITMTILPSLIDSGKADQNCPNFFDDINLYGEVRDYIAKANMWSTVNEDTGECYIPW